MKEVEVYLLLGSNKGNRLKYLIGALNLLKKVPHLKILECSSVYETLPEGVKEIQPAYLNMVIKCETNLNPHELLKVIEFVEKKMGRKNKRTKRSRTIDIDILMFGDTVLKAKNLTIPHPQIARRKFVPYLLYEISPHLIHSELKLPVRDLIARERTPPFVYMKKEEILKFL